MKFIFYVALLFSSFLGFFGNNEITETKNVGLPNLVKTKNMGPLNLVEPKDIELLNPVDTEDMKPLNPVETEDVRPLNPVKTKDMGQLNLIETKDIRLLNPVDTEDIGPLNLAKTNDIGPLRLVETTNVELLNPVEAEDMGPLRLAETSDIGSLSQVETKDMKPLSLVKTEDVGPLNLANGTSDKPIEKCTFYCFLVKNTCEKFNSPIELEPYKNLSCSHMVYGFTVVDKTNWTLAATWWDDPDINKADKNPIVSNLRDGANMTVLLGVFDNGTLPLTNTTETREKLAKEIIGNARWHGFQGIFFYVSLGSLDFDPPFFELIKTLHNETYADLNTTGHSKKRLKIIVSFGASYAIHIWAGFKEIGAYVDGFYLRADDTASKKLKEFGTYVDPLDRLGPNLTQTIVPEETIIKVTKNLNKTGIQPQKIIIGLSAWTNSFLVDGNEIQKGNDNITRQSDGKLAYFEICKIKNETNIVYDNSSKTMAFRKGNVWYSLNVPGHKIFEEKINWIAENNFGGIGLASLKADDKDDICKQGPFPIHRYVGDHFQCHRRGKHVAMKKEDNEIDKIIEELEKNMKEDENEKKSMEEETTEKKSTKEASCNRFCVINPEVLPVNFLFKNLEPHWCSHIVVSSVRILIGSNSFNFPSKTQNFIKNFKKWKTTSKPKLIISFGAEESPDTWRAVLQTKALRKIIIDGIKKVIAQTSADGVDISWTTGNLASPRDTEVYSLFLQELRENIKNYTIIAEITAQSTITERYDFYRLNNSVNFVIAHGHRFYSHKKAFTGHHSPLFMHDVLVDVRMTIEGFTSELVKRGMPKEKILVGLTAEAMGIRLPLTETDASKVEIGFPSTTFDFVRRGNKPGVISQTEVCKSRRKNSTHESFISKIGIPYLVDEFDFIAFDDTRSIKLKTVWESMNGYAGIALFGVEMDNIEGECPENEPYPILKTIVNTQTCGMCPAQSSAQNVTDDACAEPSFHVLCGYRLFTENGTNPLEPFEIPYKKCTGIVVEKAILNKNGDLSYEPFAQDSLQKLIKFQPQNKSKTKLISAIQCDKNMSADEFENLIKNHTNLITKLINHMKLFGFAGIEFRCDDLITSKTGASFSKMLDNIQNHLNTLTDNKECQKTIGIRIKIQTNLMDSYDVSSLNKLNMVVIDSSPITTNVSKILNPLFQLSPSDKSETIESAVRSWIDKGIDSKKIAFVIPSYGIRQKFIDIKKIKFDEQSEFFGLGEHVKEQFEFLTQEKVCSELQKLRFVDKISVFEVVGVYAENINHEFLTYETRETVDYKLKYAIRENLGGVTFDSLNYDDFENACKTGPFPLLQAIDLTTCSV